MALSVVCLAVPVCLALSVYFGRHGRRKAHELEAAELGSLLRPLRAVLGCSWNSVTGLGPLLGHLTASRAEIEPVSVVLGHSRGLCGRSWAALKAYVAGPGLLLGPQWAVLGSWGRFGKL